MKDTWYINTGKFASDFAAIATAFAFFAPMWILFFRWWFGIFGMEFLF